MNHSKDIWSEVINAQKAGYMVFNNELQLIATSEKANAFLNIEESDYPDFEKNIQFRELNGQPVELIHLIDELAETDHKKMVIRNNTKKSDNRYKVQLASELEYDGIILKISLQTNDEPQNDLPQNIQNLIDNLSDGFWTLNVSNLSVELSEKWTEEIGQPELESKSAYQWWLSKIHPKDLEMVKENFTPFLSGEHDHYNAIFRIKTKSEKYKWIREHGIVLKWNFDGKPEQLIISVNDVEKQKKLIRTLNDSIAREQELVDLKTRFVSMASHEFRTPLATILLSVETLEAYWERMDKQNIESKMKRIKNNVIFLKNVIENVLSLTHAESGKIKVNKSKIDVYQLIDGIAYEYVEIQKKPNPIRLFPDDKEFWIEADKQLMEQVFKNLLSNAIKYTPDGQEITVNIIEKKDAIEVVVCDQGIGISEEDQQSLFNPFFRGKNVANIRGTGLGLSLTKEFIELHQGELNVQSVINKGSTFTVHLPK